MLLSSGAWIHLPPPTCTHTYTHIHSIQIHHHTHNHSPPSLSCPPSMLTRWHCWWCLDLMLMTSCVTKSPLPPPALLAIVNLTVIALVCRECGVAVARSLSKWCKRARVLLQKLGPFFGGGEGSGSWVGVLWVYWTLSWSEGSFLLWQSSLWSAPIKNQEICVWCRDERDTLMSISRC